jgi:hypothetical protein
MLAALSLAFVAAAASLAQGPLPDGVRPHAPPPTNGVRFAGASVYGQVRSEGSSTPLRGALVEIISAGVSMHAATDSAGSYFLKNVPVGRRLLRATHIDHAPLEVEIIVSDRA